MASFALITEGITDQVAISSILYGLYSDEPDIREVQPMRDATDEAKQGSPAGWEKVLEYCSLKEFSEIFSTNDYAIIQVDTDVCGHANFPVAIVDAGGERLEADLVNAVKNLIISKIDPDVIRNYGARIFYAISVHSLECWLIPLHSDARADKGRTKNCAAHLTRALSRKNINFQKDYRTYLALTKPLLKGAAIDLARGSSESLNIFIESLPAE